MHNGKTGAQRVNRFPRTVMEAVFGLNSYLQNQFGALADIYMPIEGITESKPLQEFVYRLCPSTIKAKSVSLDRIYGKTLAWNQLANCSSSISGSQNNVTWSYANNTLTIVVGTGGASANSGIGLSSIPWIVGHKYLFSSGMDFTPSSNTIRIGNIYYQWFDSAKAIWTCLGSIGGFYAHIASGCAAGTYHIYGPMVVDLTLLYGSEIDGMTDAQILAKFESEFPGYHDYSAGKLISNDAKSVETVGFNVWDGSYKAGYRVAGDGTENATASMNVTDYVPVIAGQDYCVTNIGAIIDVTGVALCWYDANKQFLSQYNIASVSGYATQFVCSAPSNAHYCRVNFLASSNPNNICINLSDPAKNGTYEPYRKSTMQLNLGSFQVRDSQGNVTTITGGLKSAGMVKDEIVGNKYIKRVGSVDMGSLSWSRAKYTDTYAFISNSISGIKGGYLGVITSRYATQHRSSVSGMDDDTLLEYTNSGYIYLRDDTYTDANIFTTEVTGVMLYYELATPIEYELVSPLVPTVKAGITEERISPNSDGLSAPMVADMTYDAQANNDSASAQYALTAGRLLNSHKLWGQDFDGTQDVSGALTGVTSITMNGALSGVTNITMSGAISGLTNINSLINISGTNVGIGKTPTTKLDVNGAVKATSIDYEVLTLVRNASTTGAAIDFRNNTERLGLIGVTAEHGLTFNNGTSTYNVFHSGNSNKSDVNWTAKYLYAECIRTNGNSSDSGVWRGKKWSSGLGDDDLAIGTHNGGGKIILYGAYIGIGNNSSGYKLDVSGTFRATGAATLGSTLSVASTSTLTGRVGIGGAPDSTNALKVTGVAYATTGIYSDGYITAGAVNSSSDARLKNGITPVMNAMETIMTLKPSEWIWNEKHHLNGQKGAGLVAQEVEKVLPFAVAKEGEYLSLNYNVFHAYEIAGLQNHEERIKALEAENAELRKRLSA